MGGIDIWDLGTQEGGVTYGNLDGNLEQLTGNWRQWEQEARGRYSWLGGRLTLGQQGF